MKKKRRRRIREKSEKEIVGWRPVDDAQGRAIIHSNETIIQVVELNKDESGNLDSITLSDGECVSHNIKTLPSSPFCNHYIFSVEYVAKVITISRINSQKKLQFEPLHKNYFV